VEEVSTEAWIASVRGLIGERWARRIGRTVIALTVVPLALGIAVFLLESQTVGQFLIAVGAGFGVLLLVLRRDPEAFLAGLRARRRVLIATGAATAVAGWVAFFAWSEIVGLLLVVLAAIPLTLTLLDVKQDPLASPLDGPPFGETGG
jgi:hypothetical protein